MNPRYLYIDRAKGLAILLVVLGHLVARQPPPGQGVEWYMLVKASIYAFHMPLFMALSGLVYGLTWRASATVAGDFRNAGSRILRLLPAYFLFGLAVFLGKLGFQNLTPVVDNPVEDGAVELLTLVLRPTASYCAFLWYIYALAILYLVFPLLFRAVHGRILWLVPLTIAFWFLPTSEWLAWNTLQVLSFFFLLGVIAGRHHGVALAWIERLWLPALIGFLVLLLPAGAQEDSVASWVAAGLSVVALPGLLRATESWKLGLLETLGRYTLIIYLTNTIFIGLVKASAFQLGLWNASDFPVVAVTMALVAIYGAILLKRHLLPLVPPLDRITT